METDSLPSFWRMALGGLGKALLITLVSSFLTNIGAKAIYDIVEKAMRPDRPDFSTNGLQWVLIGIVVALPIASLLVNFVTFVIVLPIVNLVLREQSQPISTWRVLLLLAGGWILVAFILVQYAGLFVIPVQLLFTLPAAYLEVRSMNERAFPTAGGATG